METKKKQKIKKTIGSITMLYPKAQLCFAFWENIDFTLEKHNSALHRNTQYTCTSLLRKAKKHKHNPVSPFT